MISCPQYDYVEIACLYKFPVQISLFDGSLVAGIAQDTSINSKQEECLVVKTEHAEEVITLTDIKIIKVMIKNPHFDQMEFN